MKLLQKIRLFAKHNFTGRPADNPAPDSDMGVVSLGLDLEEYYRDLNELRAQYEINALDTVQYGATRYPIYRIDVNPGGEKKLLILSGTHGNEHAGIISVVEFLQLIQSGDYSIPDSIHTVVVTPHNPAGIANFSRFNTDGYDLNRDFRKLLTCENRALVRLFGKLRPDFTVSLHEGPQEGTFIFTNREVYSSIASEVLGRLRVDGVELSSKSYFGNRLKSPGYFPLVGFFGFLAKVQSRILKLESFGVLCDRKKVPSITLETPWKEGGKEQRTDVHTKFLIHITDILSGN